MSFQVWILDICHISILLRFLYLLLKLESQNRASNQPKMTLHRQYRHRMLECPYHPFYQGKRVHHTWLHLHILLILFHPICCFSSFLYKFFSDTVFTIFLDRFACRLPNYQCIYYRFCLSSSLDHIFCHFSPPQCKVKSF